MESTEKKADDNDCAYADCHCHLQSYSQEELKAVIDTCIKKGMIALLTNATNPKDFNSTLEIASNSQSMRIIPGFGYHPWELAYAQKHGDWFEEFVSFLNQIPASVSYFIGEIGIDGGKIKKTYPLDFQIEIFVRQLQYANERNLMAQIHCVYEWDKLFKVMAEMKLDNLIKNGKIVLHSFQGKPKHIAKFNTFNVWYSLSSGCFNEKNYDMIKQLPVEKLLYESDSPSMFNSAVYPIDFDNKELGLKDCKDNKKNTPLSIQFLNSKVSGLKGVPEKELRIIVLNNSKSIIDSISFQA